MDMFRISSAAKVSQAPSVCTSKVSPPSTILKSSKKSHGQRKKKRSLLVQSSKTGKGKKPKKRKKLPKQSAARSRTKKPKTVKRKRVTAKPQVSENEIREPTLPEKLQLRSDLLQLQSADLLKVIKIIQKDGGGLTAEGNELEMDIEKLTPTTFYHLKKFVAQKKLSKTKAKKSAVTAKNSNATPQFCDVAPSSKESLIATPSTVSASTASSASGVISSSSLSTPAAPLISAALSHLSAVTLACGVCASEKYSVFNMMVQCDECSRRFHQTCKSIRQIPEKNWYCSPECVSLSGKWISESKTTKGKVKPTTTATSCRENVARNLPPKIPKAWDQAIANTSTSTKTRDGIAGFTTPSPPPLYPGRDHGAHSGQASSKSTPSPPDRYDLTSPPPSLTSPPRGRNIYGTPQPHPFVVIPQARYPSPGGLYNVTPYGLQPIALFPLTSAYEFQSPPRAQPQIHAQAKIQAQIQAQARFSLLTARRSQHKTSVNFHQTKQIPRIPIPMRPPPTAPSANGYRTFMLPATGTSSGYSTSMQGFAQPSQIYNTMMPYPQHTGYTPKQAGSAINESAAFKRIATT